MTGALFLSFFIMQHLYLPAATVLKRWAGETASGVFVHVDESLQGMDVIRAFGAVDYFIQGEPARHGLWNGGCTRGGGRVRELVHAGCCTGAAARRGPLPAGA